MGRTLGQLVAEARSHLGDYSASLSSTSTPPGNTLSGTYTLRTVGQAIQDVRGVLKDPMPSPVPATTRTFGSVIAEIRAALRDPTPSGTGSTYSGTATTLTLGAIITSARGFLNDPASPYRYPDADLYSYISDALRLTRRFRPDLFETGGTSALPVYTPANASTPFPVDEGYYTAFVQYVVAAAETRDDTTAQEGESSQLAQSFMAILSAPPYRYSEAFFYIYINEALLTMRRLRPDLFEFAGSQPLPVYTHVTHTNTPFPVDETFIPATVQYVTGMALLRDATDKADKAAAMVQAFVATVQTAPYRYSDTLLYTYFNDALLTLRRLRPDLFDLAPSTGLLIYTPADANKTFPVDEVYFPPVVQYVAGLALLRDMGAGKSEEKGERASALMSAFAANAKSPPHRFSDAFLYEVATDAFHDARRIRPDLFHGQMRMPWLTYTPADAATPFPLDERYYTPVVDYVVGRAEWRDHDPSTVNAPSSVYQTKPPTPTYLTGFATVLRTL
jgi:hypothetical protein